MCFFKKEEGFTLLEIMVTLVLGVILFLAFSRVFVFGLQSEAYIDNKLQAKSIASDIVEYIRQNRNLLDNTEEKNEIEWNDVEEPFEAEIIDKPYNSNNHLREVTIKIIWQERGNEKNYILYALLAGD